MTHRTSIIILFVLLGCAACFGQTAYDGLMPGRSTRADVERVLGQPIRRISETLLEYPPPAVWRQQVSQIFIQYRKNSFIIERIEILTLNAMDRATIIAGLRLPPQPIGRRINARGVLEEYFGAPAFFVSTYVGSESASGVARTGRYSRELFESTVATLREPARPQRPNAQRVATGGLADKVISVTQPEYSEIARSQRVSGTVVVEITVDEAGAVISARALSGPPLLWHAAVTAARQMRFKPTLENGKPVKVTGKLSYDFKLN